MKQNLYFFCFLFIVVSCKDKPAQAPVDYTDKSAEITTSIYPENITKVMEAHGGLDAWNKTKTLVFGIERPEGMELTTTDLKSRKSLIETDKFKIGFDGNDVWIDDSQKVFKNNPKFYYNLMFYFYAMPFVLADDGISYYETEPLQFEGESYPGIKISYEAGIGESPEDEYILYYNPENYKMEWLAYTVTYFSKEKSKDWHFIKYSDWEMLEGLILPKTIQWYNNEGMTVTELRNSVDFVNTLASLKSRSASFYAMPEGAMKIE